MLKASDNVFFSSCKSAYAHASLHELNDQEAASRILHILSSQTPAMLYVSPRQSSGSDSADRIANTEDAHTSSASQTASAWRQSQVDRPDQATGGSP